VQQVLCRRRLKDGNSEMTVRRKARLPAEPLPDELRIMSGQSIDS
jgi:hypothetical protein